MQKIVNKRVCQSEFSSINPWSAHCFLMFYKKRSQIRCTGLLSSRRLDDRNLTCFIQNLLHNLMNLVSRSKSDKKLPKNG